jgi:hypothetical protein
MAQGPAFAKKKFLFRSIAPGFVRSFKTLPMGGWVATKAARTASPALAQAQRERDIAAPDRRRVGPSASNSGRARVFQGSVAE